MSKKSTSAPRTNKSNASAKKQDSINVGRSKINANNELKLNIYSLSGIVRHVKGDANAKRIVNGHLKLLNEKHGVKVTLGEVTTRTIIVYGSKSELNLKDGTPRDKFSFWTLLNCLSRQVQDVAKGSKQLEKAKVKKAEQRAKTASKPKAASKPTAKVDSKPKAASKPTAKTASKPKAEQAETKAA